MAGDPDRGPVLAILHAWQTGAKTHRLSRARTLTIPELQAK